MQILLRVWNTTPKYPPLASLWTSPPSKWYTYFTPLEHVSPVSISRSIPVEYPIDCIPTGGKAELPIRVACNLRNVRKGRNTIISRSHDDTFLAIFAHVSSVATILGFLHLFIAVDATMPINSLNSINQAYQRSRLFRWVLNFQLRFAAIRVSIARGKFPPPKKRPETIPSFSPSLRTTGFRGSSSTTSWLSPRTSNLKKRSQRTVEKWKIRSGCFELRVEPSRVDYNRPLGYTVVA